MDGHKDTQVSAEDQGVSVTPAEDKSENGDSRLRPELFEHARRESGTSRSGVPSGPRLPRGAHLILQSDMDRRTAAVWEVLEREIRAFGKGIEDQPAQPITDVQVQAFTQRACAAMARTGFGGDAYHAGNDDCRYPISHCPFVLSCAFSSVMALMGSSNKVIRPVVKPNQESIAAKIASDDLNDFDPQDPLPIHIDVLPRSRMVQVTTTSVFDIHLMEHLSAPEQYVRLRKCPTQASLTPHDAHRTTQVSRQR